MTYEEATAAIPPEVLEEKIAKAKNSAWDNNHIVAQLSNPGLGTMTPNAAMLTAWAALFSAIKLDTPNAYLSQDMKCICVPKTDEEITKQVITNWLYANPVKKG